LLAPSSQSVPLSTIYIRSLYWSLATMSALGYGNGPAAWTDSEFLYSVFNQVVGACLSAAIFSNVAQMINKQDSTSRRYQEQSERIGEFVRFSRLPRELNQRLRCALAEIGCDPARSTCCALRTSSRYSSASILTSVRCGMCVRRRSAYNDFMFAVNQGLDVNALCKVFPSNLRGEIFYEMHQKLVRQVPMFKDCNDNFIRAIVKILQPLVLLNGDYCFRIHETSGEMYFIHRGFMQSTQEPLQSKRARRSHTQYPRRTPACAGALLA
jgi:hypothetical protein